MASQEGGFYSALDADSEGVEGKYYVWNKKEITEILGKDADVFCLYFDVTDGGNFEGHTILNNNINASTVAFHFGIGEDQVRKIITDGSKKLLETRSKRIRPGLDDKILTSWNALMISAFAKGYRVTDESAYLEAAEKCITFMEKNMISGTHLLRTYKNGKAKLQAYLEDYAYFINSLIDVFEITAEPRYLLLAANLGNHMIDHFWDEKSNSFYFTADDHERLIIRPKNNYDLSMPSGNSVAANCMLKLYHLTQQNQFLEIPCQVSRPVAVAGKVYGINHTITTIAAAIVIVVLVISILLSFENSTRSFVHLTLSATYFCLPKKSKATNR